MAYIVGKREERDALFVVDFRNFLTKRKPKREQESTQKQVRTTLMLE